MCFKRKFLLNLKNNLLFIFLKSIVGKCGLKYIDIVLFLVLWKIINIVKYKRYKEVNKFSLIIFCDKIDIESLFVNDCNFL